MENKAAEKKEHKFKVVKSDAEWKKQLTQREYEVLRGKETEDTNLGYTDCFDEGVYKCKGCGAALYNSSSKFQGHCGWPAFDDEIEGAVLRVPDEDNYAIEIVCANCGGHLGHVFHGENYTKKNIRHCVNSISVVLEKAKLDKDKDKEKEKEKEKTFEKISF